jgi:hypothetical protein
MARIQINDLPVSQKISKEDMKKIRGGVNRHYYLIIEDDGSTYIKFSDGITGAVLPSGSSVSATYRTGAGKSG